MTVGSAAPQDQDTGPLDQDTSAAADAFLDHRPMLYALAYRILGSAHDAEDVVQEAYLRWSGADRTTVAQPRRYLTRVVARLCVDSLRARQARRESYVGEWLPEPVATDPSPFGEVDTSDLSVAVLHLMEQLTPPQRAVYVLREAFGLPYQEIAGIVGRTQEDCRQMHRRAVRAVRARRPRFVPSREEQQRLLTGFVAAAREGDLARLERMLHADAVAYSDGGGRAPAAINPVTGRAKVARLFAGICSRPRYLTVVPVELNGGPALLLDRPRGRAALLIDVDGTTIANLYIVTNPEKLTGMARWSGGPIDPE